MENNLSYFEKILTVCKGAHYTKQNADYSGDTLKLIIPSRIVLNDSFKQYPGMNIPLKLEASIIFKDPQSELDCAMAINIFTRGFLNCLINFDQNENNEFHSKNTIEEDPIINKFFKIINKDQKSNNFQLVYFDHMTKYYMAETIVKRGSIIPPDLISSNMGFWSIHVPLDCTNDIIKTIWDNWVLLQGKDCSKELYLVFVGHDEKHEYIFDFLSKSEISEICKKGFEKDLESLSDSDKKKSLHSLSEESHVDVIPKYELDVSKIDTI